MHGSVYGLVHGSVLGLVRLDLGVGSCLDGEGEELIGGWCVSL